MPSLKVPRLRRQAPPPPPPEPDLDDEYDDEDGNGARMGFFDHLNELRIRVFRSAFALVIGTLIGVALATPTLEVLQGPYCKVTTLNDMAAQGETIDYDHLVIDYSKCQFQVLGPTGGVVAFFRVSIMLGAAFAIPMITYQLLMFVFPGLTRREKRVVLISLPAVTLLFIVGVLFSWFVLMPPALGFLEGFQQNLFRSEWTADSLPQFCHLAGVLDGRCFRNPAGLLCAGLPELDRPACSDSQLANRGDWRGGRSSADYADN